MVSEYRNVKPAPAVSLVEGQSARARSRPLYASIPPLHSLPSGMTCRSRPFTSATRMLSHSATSAPAATAALQAAEPFCCAVPAPHAYARLTGLDGAPCASAAAGSRTRATSEPTADAAIAADARRTVMAAAPNLE